jgi:hypothetical protein
MQIMNRITTVLVFILAMITTTNAAAHQFKVLAKYETTDGKKFDVYVGEKGKMPGNIFDIKKMSIIIEFQDNLSFMSYDRITFGAHVNEDNLRLKDDGSDDYTLQKRQLDISDSYPKVDMSQTLFDWNDINNSMGIDRVNIDVWYHLKDKYLCDYEKGVREKTKDGIVYHDGIEVIYSFCWRDKYKIKNGSNDMLYKDRVNSIVSSIDEQLKSINQEIEIAKGNLASIEQEISDLKSHRKKLKENTKGKSDKKAQNALIDDMYSDSLKVLNKKKIEFELVLVKSQREKTNKESNRKSLLDEINKTNEKLSSDLTWKIEDNFNEQRILAYKWMQRELMKSHKLVKVDLDGKNTPKSIYIREDFDFHVINGLSNAFSFYEDNSEYGKLSGRYIDFRSSLVVEISDPMKDVCVKKTVTCDTIFKDFPIEFQIEYKDGASLKTEIVFPEKQDGFVYRLKYNLKDVIDKEITVKALYQINDDKLLISKRNFIVKRIGLVTTFPVVSEISALSGEKNEKDPSFSSSIPLSLGVALDGNSFVSGITLPWLFGFNTREYPNLSNIFMLYPHVSFLVPVFEDDAEGQTVQKPFMAAGFGAMFIRAISFSWSVGINGEGKGEHFLLIGVSIPDLAKELVFD